MYSSVLFTRGVIWAGWICPNYMHKLIFAIELLKLSWKVVFGNNLFFSFLFDGNIINTKVQYFVNIRFLNFLIIIAMSVLAKEKCALFH